MQTAQLYGRPRNCWTLARRKLVRLLQNATWARAEFRRDFKELCQTRIEAASYENGYVSKRIGILTHLAAHFYSLGYISLQPCIIQFICCF